MDDAQKKRIETKKKLKQKKTKINLHFGKFWKNNPYIFWCAAVARGGSGANAPPLDARPLIHKIKLLQS